MAPTPWTITRLELLYYSRRHKRWQIWQEAAHSQKRPTTEASVPGELHRAQIFSLLSTVRASLREASPTTGCRIAAPGRIRAFEIEEKGLREDLLRVENFWLGYLQYIRATAHEYGIPASSGLDAFLDDERLKHLQPCKIKIKRSVALDLISMLPVLRHWDLQGCWFRAMTGKAKNQPYWSPEGSVWGSPLYMAAITDRKYGTSAPRGPRLVERPQNVALIYEDLGAFDSKTRRWEPRRYGPKDFFECCYRPTSGDELRLYQCYAFLFDKLLSMLNPPNDNFFIAYPIQVLGRINFLHLWVSNDQGSLEDLWHFWFEDSGGDPSNKSPHRGVWASIHEFLRFNLRGIAHSNFQAAWQKRMTMPPEHGQPNPKPLEYSLCECAHLLMPLDWIRWRKWKRGRDPRKGPSQESLWAYRPYDCNENRIKTQLGKTSRWGSRSPEAIKGDKDSGSLGMKWERTRDSHEVGLKRGQVKGTIAAKDYIIDFAIRPSSVSAPSRNVISGAVRLAIEQQLALGEMFQKQQEAVQKTIDSWLTDELKRHCAVPANIEKFKCLGVSALDVPFAVNGARDPIVKQALQRFGPEPTLKTIALALIGRKATIETLMKQRIPFHMSLYLEIGPIAALTHYDTDHWNEDELCLTEGLTQMKKPPFFTGHRGWHKSANDLYAKAASPATYGLIGASGWLPNESARAHKKMIEDLHKSVRRQHPYREPGPFKGVDGIKYEPITNGAYPFRPCVPILDMEGPNLAQAVIDHACGEGTVYSGALKGEYLKGLGGQGYSKIQPWLARNVFAFKYTVSNGEPADILKGTKIKALASGCSRVGCTVVAGFLADGETVVVEVANETTKTITDTFGQNVPKLHCKEKDVFLAIVVETARLS